MFVEALLVRCGDSSIRKFASDSTLSPATLVPIHPHRHTITPLLHQEDSTSCLKTETLPIPPSVSMTDSDASKPTNPVVFFDIALGGKRIA